MKITIAILDCARWIAGILLAMEIPFAWILRDGLGPGAHETSGLEAVIRMLFFPGIRVLAIAFIALSVAVRLLSSRCAGEESGAKRSWKEALYAFALALLLCLLGVGVFQYCVGREKQRRAEVHYERIQVDE